LFNTVKNLLPKCLEFAFDRFHSVYSTQVWQIGVDKPLLLSIGMRSHWREW